MERVIKWVLPVLLVAEVILVWSGWIDLRTAVWVAVAIEVSLVLVTGRQAVVVVRRYRRNRAEGLDLERAFEDSLTAVLPRKLARLVALELAVWGCIGQWVARRRPDGADSFAYRKRSLMGGLLVLVLLTAPAEILVIELLVPWTWLRVGLLILSIYSLIWFVGLYASLVVRPHRLEPTGVLLRHGLWARARIPYEAIGGVDVLQRQIPGGGDGLMTAVDEGAASLAVGGRTDVVLRLRVAHSLARVFDSTQPVTTIYVAVDEPNRFVEAVRQRLEDRCDLPVGVDEVAPAQYTVAQWGDDSNRSSAGTRIGSVGDSSSAPAAMTRSSV